MSAYAFLSPKTTFPLPRSFDFAAYIETEREFWALFPETEGKRVNFCQSGLTARVFIEALEDGSELKTDETYFLMPCEDRKMRPVRMHPCRRLTLSEFRMSHLTAIRLKERLAGTSAIMERVHIQVLGPEVIEELDR